MGFMDKAKKLAEQAQQKLDEAQNQLNSSQPQYQGDSGVTYDKHGRPVQDAPPRLPPSSPWRPRRRRIPPRPSANRRLRPRPLPSSPLRRPRGTRRTPRLTRSSRCSDRGRTHRDGHALRGGRLG
jgi:hypothetical protein